MRLHGVQTLFSLSFPNSKAHLIKRSNVSKSVCCKVVCSALTYLLFFALVTNLSNSSSKISLVIIDLPSSNLKPQLRQYSKSNSKTLSFELPSPKYLTSASFVKRTSSNSMNETCVFLIVCLWLWITYLSKFSIAIICGRVYKL